MIVRPPNEMSPENNLLSIYLKMGLKSVKMVLRTPDEVDKLIYHHIYLKTGRDFSKSSCETTE